MPDQTFDGRNPRVEIPVTQSPEEIYDAIMGQIEPELTSAQVSLLAEKYKDEAPEQKEERAERYTKAKQEYDRRLSLFNQDLQEKARLFQIEGMRSVEAEARSAEVTQLSDIESSLSSL